MTNIEHMTETAIETAQAAARLRLRIEELQSLQSRMLFVRENIKELSAVIADGCRSARGLTEQEYRRICDETFNFEEASQLAKDAKHY